MKYPELNPLEARQYEILMHKRDKVEALIKLMYDVIGFDEENFKPFPCEAAKEQYYRLVEAIVKGGVISGEGAGTIAFCEESGA